MILAAGMGRRLGKLTEHLPKCMVEVSGRPLIDHSIDALVQAGIRRLILVVGHGSEFLKQHLEERRPDIEIVYVTNPIYAETNNIYSVLLARDEMETDDTILLESDVIFDPAILKECIENPAPNVAVVARYQPWMDGTVVTANKREQIKKFISKNAIDWDKTHRYLKTVNIYKLSREFSRDSFMPFLKAYIQSRGLSEYYEDVLKVLVQLASGDLSAQLVGNHLWYEVDDAQDLDIADALFMRDAAKLEHFQKRYGGYWRFPNLKDFCYLVNPYFPPRQLVEELTRSFPMAISQYPSGLNVQNRLAARMFQIDPSCVLTGNGASELIRLLLAEIPGSIGIPVPTFDEYRASVSDNRLVEFRPRRSDYRYTPEDLLEFCRDSNVDTLVLINPDNPTGHFLSKSQLIELLEGLQRQGTRLILDESFVDFADCDAPQSLLNQNILDAYPTLVVVKSISKSYGVPGLRLGVLATRDNSLLDQVKRQIPVWNINSIAECFLQIIPKYLSQYVGSCRKLAIERERFYCELDRISFIRPLRSQANYILCEVKQPQSACALVTALLNDHWILAKDCTAKLGFDGRSFLRIAVRDTVDNEILLHCLRAMENDKTSDGGSNLPSGHDSA